MVELVPGGFSYNSEGLWDSPKTGKKNKREIRTTLECEAKKSHWR